VSRAPLVGSSWSVPSLALRRVRVIIPGNGFRCQALA
jgi:hypothetical protein